MVTPLQPEPQDPVLLFDEDGHMYVVHDLAVTNELIEDTEPFYAAFDGLGRPVRPIGPPGRVSFVLVSDQADEVALRSLVARYYAVWAARHPYDPPQVEDIAGFIDAVANDEVME